MELGHFSSLFEVLAALNLAYAGIDSFRQRLFYLLGEYFTPPAVRKDLEDFKNKITTLLGESLNEEIVKLENNYDLLDKLMKANDNSFLKEGRSFKPVFFWGFLFCFGNLLLMGFEQFFVEYSSILAEQWLFICFLFIILMFFLKTSGKSYQFLANHKVIISLYLLIIGLSFGFMFCRWRVPGIIIPAPVIAAVTVLVGISPFILEYFRVQKYVSTRTNLIVPKLEKMKQDISVLDKAVDIVEQITPQLLPRVRMAYVERREQEKQARGTPPPPLHQEAQPAIQTPIATRPRCGDTGGLNSKHKPCQAIATNSGRCGAHPREAS